MPARVVSVDILRGLTMALMLSEGFALDPLLRHTPLEWLGAQFEHQPWNGMRLWDMIQPMFMFLVGVSMPFALAVREARGATWSQTLGHVLKRAGLLIFWGLVARSAQAGYARLDLINVLAQIAFTYTVAFLLIKRVWWQQLLAGLVLLGVHEAMYWLGQPPTALSPYEPKNNYGALLDFAVLGKNWGGGYATINCISSAFNTIAGVLAGYVLMKEKGSGRLRSLLISAAVCVAVGWAISPIVPINKKIWTASFALVSTGITLAAVGLASEWIDERQHQRGLELFKAIGMNSIFIYVAHEILHGYLFRAFDRGLMAAGLADPTVLTLVPLLTIFMAELALCWWLYQRKLFFKL